MRSMGEGDRLEAQRLWRSPSTIRYANGPPPRAGEELCAIS